MNDQNLLPSKNTKVTLMLCAVFAGEETGEQPLAPRQYTRIVQWLKEKKLSPSQLLDKNIQQKLIQENPDMPEACKIPILLKREADLDLAIDKWVRQSIWVIGRGDASYPHLLKNRLGHNAPPLLFGCGSKKLLYLGGLAVVGAREADEEALMYTQEIARLCADENIQILSGGAKGVDQTAMLTILKYEGTSLGILPDSLAHKSKSKSYQQAILDKKLTLISPYSPEAGFCTGNAMGRNRLIYAMSTWGLAVSSGLESGGTWQGATDNLKKGWVPMIIREGETVPPGNKKLIELGGKKLEKKDLNAPFSLRNWMGKLPLKLPIKIQKKAKPAPLIQEDLFWNNTIWPTLKELLNVELNAKDMANQLNIVPSQAQAWLKRAVLEGKAKKLLKPVRYINMEEVNEP